MSAVTSETVAPSEAELQPQMALVETLYGLQNQCKIWRELAINRDTPPSSSLAQRLAIIQAAPSLVQIAALALNRALQARGYRVTLSVVVRAEAVALSTAHNSPADVVVHALRGFGADLQPLTTTELQPLITLVETVNGLKVDCEQLTHRTIQRATPLKCSLEQQLAILQAAPSVLYITALALNHALDARGYRLTMSAVTPTPRKSPDDVVQALRSFAAHNNLVIQIRYTAHRCFHAEIATTDNLFDVVDLVRPANCFVVSVYGQSPSCGVSDNDAMPKAEYDLARQISGRQLLVSSFPRVELAVPDLLTCAVDKQEIAA